MKKRYRKKAVAAFKAFERFLLRHRGVDALSERTAQPVRLVRRKVVAASASLFGPKGPKNVESKM